MQSCPFALDNEQLAPFSPILNLANLSSFISLRPNGHSPRRRFLLTIITTVRVHESPLGPSSSGQAPAPGGDDIERYDGKKKTIFAPFLIYPEGLERAATFGFQAVTFGAAVL